IQWHEQAADPPGDSRSDSWFVYHLGLRLKDLYKDSKLDRDMPIRHLTWDYKRDFRKRLPDGSNSRIIDEPEIEKILKEINGYRVSDRKQLKSYEELKDDGSTACGGWCYCGVFPAADNNRANSRNPRLVGWIYPEWGYSWPHNRRIMYNRASADPQGKPWSERKKLIWWDEEKRKWTGLDVPDFEPDKPPSYRPGPWSRGMKAIAGDAPFIQHPDGRGWLFATGGVKDGPLPTHYEPRESPVRNRLYDVQYNPTLNLHQVAMNPLAAPTDPNFPIAATTYRLTEHYLSGPMSRFNSWLNELQPEMFVELSPELAAERGIEHGKWIVVATPRGEIEARAMVTRRIKPLMVQGRMLHQIGIPIHWGYAGESVGAISNELTSLITEPNVSMHEAKSFACQVRAGRSARQHAKALPVAPLPSGGPIPNTPPSAQPEGPQGQNRVDGREQQKSNSRNINR
ncbi:MAG: molybdopterin dinucleotide binding domain-containing protein, partial [Candidatus Binataceae bacterium]